MCPPGARPKPVRRRAGIRAGALVALLTVCAGCQAVDLVRYALLPDYPQFADGDAHRLPDLHAPVEVVRRPDGLWKISADDEHDALLAEGYLQARDRLAQLDIFRHVARGELAALIGNRPFGERSALDADRMNRFLGFRDQARLLYERTSAEERLALQAFVRGINAWIAEGHASLEHRLLGVDKVQPWTPYDSLSIYLMVMHSLGSNWDREIRRLADRLRVGASTPPSGAGRRTSRRTYTPCPTRTWR